MKPTFFNQTIQMSLLCPKNTHVDGADDGEMKVF